MAVLFQSNPDQWDLRQYLRPGGRASWFVNRYLSYMKRGTLTVLWEAQGKQRKAVRGLYGWGILHGEPARDVRGLLRAPLTYIERWVSADDTVNEVPLAQQVAAIPADDVLELESWRDHLLARMPIGTNFLIDKKQIEELSGVVMRRYRRSAFGEAAELDAAGESLPLDRFETRAIQEEAGDG